MSFFKYDIVVRLVKDKYDEISKENLSTKSGYEKAKLYMSDILAKADVPNAYHDEYLSREMIRKCLKDASDAINREREKAEQEQLSAIKKDERILERNLSFCLTDIGKEKTINYCKTYVDYYKFQIEACDIAIATLNGDTAKRNALFNHSSNTWAYHGGIASAIAGPAAGIMMASQAKQRDDERNAFNAQLMALNIQYRMEKEREIKQDKEKLKSKLIFWEKALESTKYQLEEKRDSKELFDALSPKIKSCTVSKTGTITLKIGLSKTKSIKVYNEKPAYIDGSIKVQFIKDDKVCGSTICYLPFGGTSSPYDATCMCTSLPALKNPDEKYEIQFLPNKLWLMESIEGLKSAICNSSYPPPKEITDWYYAKIESEKAAKKAREEAEQRAIQREKEVLEREENKKASLKNHKPKIIAGSILLIATIFLLIFLPNPINYNSAMKLISKGDFAGAATILESLDDYKDSRLKLIDCMVMMGDFRSAYSEKEYIIPDGVTEIPDRAFYPSLVTSSKLEKVTIPNSVKTIGKEAFSGCKYLTSITIPEGVKSIGIRSFENCESLESIVIPNSVTNIDVGAFSNCGNLKSITIGNGISEISDNMFSRCYDLTNLVIPNGVTSIGDHAFEDCYSLTSITIPDSVTSIGERAFSGCKSLTSITLPDNLTSIGDSAFSGCRLTNITLPNGITSISKAFSGCDFTSITIPDSVTSIDNRAFEYCRSLVSIIIPDSVTSIGDYAFSDCSSLTSIIIPDSVTNIGEDAFSNCSSLTSITLPYKLTSIGDAAFYRCSSLASITIPDSVTSIGRNAFEQCSSLTSITLPDNLTSIGIGTFMDCSSLKSITIPDSVTSIMDSAFSSCISLNYVYYTGSKSQWNAISIGRTNYYLEDATIYYNHILEE